MAPLPQAARTLQAKTLRTSSAEGYYLLGIKFSRPLTLTSRPRAKQRKLLSRM
jgi:hypothetical protein